MALEDEVLARYPTGNNYIIRLTNPGVNDPSGVNLAHLQTAVADVQADFLTYVGFAYDNTETQHRAVGVEGCIAYLLKWMGQADPRAEDLFEKYLTRLRSLRRRLLPHSTSKLTPTDEKRGQATVRPDFDDVNLDAFIPDNEGPRNPIRDV